MDSSKGKQQFGIHELYHSQEPVEVDLVVVYGLNGDATRTWTSERNNLCWMNSSQMLPKYIKRSRVLSWSYNANVFSFNGRTTSADRILQHAHTLVAQLQADRELEGASERPIIFLCHSLGGIIVKRALAYSFAQTSAKSAHLQSIATCTYGVLFFGTPHQGTSKARLAGTLQKLAATAFPQQWLQTDSSLLRALEEDSEILQNITDQFTPLMKLFRIYFFWEQERTNLGYTKDYVVEESSAAPNLYGTERSGIAADHQRMCRFQQSSDAGFRTVVAALRRYCQDAPKTIRMRRGRAEELLRSERWHEAAELTGFAAIPQTSSVTGNPGHSDHSCARQKPHIGIERQNEVREIDQSPVVRQSSFVAGGRAEEYKCCAASRKHDSLAFIRSPSLVA